MRLNDNFSNWYRPQPFSFVSVRYDATCESSTQKIVESYLGTRLNLPPFKKRNSKIEDHPKFEQLEKTYGSLARDIAKAKPVKIWEPL